MSWNRTILLKLHSMNEVKKWLSGMGYLSLAYTISYIYCEVFHIYNLDEIGIN